MVRSSSKKTPYELLKGKKPSLAHFKVFRTKSFIHVNDKRDLDKFEVKSESEIFLDYFEHSRAYRVFNLKNECVEESPHVNFDESTDKTKNHSCRDIDDVEIFEKKTKQGNQKLEITPEGQADGSSTQGEVTTIEGNSLRNIRVLRNHLLDNVISSLHEPPRT